jgi:hypothetical protein
LRVGLDVGHGDRDEDSGGMEREGDWEVDVVEGLVPAAEGAERYGVGGRGVGGWGVGGCASDLELGW